jgi:hypothetical protein
VASFEVKQDFGHSEISVDVGDLLLMSASQWMMLSPPNHRVPSILVPTVELLKLPLNQYDLPVDLLVLSINHIVSKYFHHLLLPSLNPNDFQIEVFLLLWHCIKPALIGCSQAIQMHMRAYLLWVDDFSGLVVLLESEGDDLVVLLVF